MFEALKLRTLVIGNSGSGESPLDEGLGALIDAPVFDLDLIHWIDNGFGAKQEEDVARQKVANLTATERWVIEGEYGWLAEVAVPRAPALIWLDIPWEVCREGLLAPGRRRGRTEVDFSELLKWAEAYWDRRRRRPSTGTSAYSKTSVLPSLGFGPERKLAHTNKIEISPHLLLGNKASLGRRPGHCGYNRLWHRGCVPSVGASMAETEGSADSDWQAEATDRGHQRDENHVG
jgi:adenylate kinase family enzyme